MMDEKFPLDLEIDETETDDDDDSIEVPAQVFYTPTTFVNHVQMLSMEDMLLLEFRTVLPDLSSLDKPRGTVEVGISADLSNVPPVSRLMVSLPIAKKLKKILARAIKQYEES